MPANPLTPFSYSVSAHPLTLGSIGPTGATGSLTVAKGNTGVSGATGSVGISGATGPIGPSVIGVTYSSGTGGDPLGGKPYHLIVRYSDGSTYDGGYFRGVTGEAEHWVMGENVGSSPRTGHPSTGGHWFQDSPNGNLILKGITGGGGVRVVDEGDSIRIAYTTFDAVQTVGGVKGQLVFLNQDAAGGTGMSGATYTNFYPGPTFSLDFTTIGYKEVAGRIRPYEYDCATHTFTYRINPNEILTFNSAKDLTSTGNTIIINPIEDYENWYDLDLGNQYFTAPFYRIIDSSRDDDDDYSFFFGDKTSCSFTLMITGENTIPRNPRIDCFGVNPTIPIENTHRTFPSNWKFPNNANPRQKMGIDIVQFISIGDKDPNTNKTEWYGLYVSSAENPFK